MKKVVVAIVALFVVSTLSRAQGLGSIAGTVTDPSGAVVNAAQVKVTEEATGFSRNTTTNAQGYYLFDALRPADYTLTIQATGFRTFTQSKFTLFADQALSKLTCRLLQSSRLLRVSASPNFRSTAATPLP